MLLTAGAAGTEFAMPPRWLNGLLEETFAGEASRLIAATRQPDRRLSSGVSLIAIVRRDAGVIEPRQRPADVPADLHDPAR